jgi:hypothetical protein
MAVARFFENSHVIHFNWSHLRSFIPVEQMMTRRFSQPFLASSASHQLLKCGDAILSFFELPRPVIGRALDRSQPFSLQKPTNGLGDLHFIFVFQSVLSKSQNVFQFFSTRHLPSRAARVETDSIRGPGWGIRGKGTALQRCQFEKREEMILQSSPCLLDLKEPLDMHQSLFFFQSCVAPELNAPRGASKRNSFWSVIIFLLGIVVAVQMIHFGPAEPDLHL